MNVKEIKGRRYEIGDYIIDVLPAANSEFFEYYLSTKEYGHKMFMFGIKKVDSPEQEESILINALLSERYVETYREEIDVMDYYYEQTMNIENECDGNCEHCNEINNNKLN